LCLSKDRVAAFASKPAPTLILQWKQRSAHTADLLWERACSRTGQ